MKFEEDNIVFEKQRDHNEYNEGRLNREEKRIQLSERRMSLDTGDRKQITTLLCALSKKLSNKSDTKNS